MAIPPQPGSYVLIGRLPKPVELTIGALGSRVFEPGVYLYVGSARGPGGLKARISRHFKKTRRLAWHFDYLKPALRPLAVWMLMSVEPYECKFVHFLKNNEGGRQIAPGFGSSDCRVGCGSHLIQFQTCVDMDNLFYRVRGEFPGLERIVL